MVIAALKRKGLKDRKISVFEGKGTYSVDIGREEVEVRAVEGEGSVILKPTGRKSKVPKAPKVYAQKPSQRAFNPRPV